VIEAGEVIMTTWCRRRRTLVLNGTVKGDLLAVGETITIGPTGVVEG